jgi:hypothetical protein
LSISLDAYPAQFLMAEAWSIEAVVELVRVCAFFIPAGIGAQEGALVLIISPITGQPPLGLTVALVRRFREILWIAWGGVIGWRFSGTLRRSNWLSIAKPKSSPIP